MSILSPYPHELNGSGTACADDCPACRWVREQRSKETPCPHSEDGIHCNHWYDGEAPCCFCADSADPNVCKTCGAVDCNGEHDEG